MPASRTIDEIVAKTPTFSKKAHLRGPTSWLYILYDITDS